MFFESIATASSAGFTYGASKPQIDSGDALLPRTTPGSYNA
jgi:hypothetical protein